VRSSPRRSFSAAINSYSNAVIDRAKRRHSAALGEFSAPFPNGAQQSVNRKVRGSNPRSGAKSEYAFRLPVNYWSTAVQQFYSNRTAT